jgi:hypothetical protein
MKKKTARGLIGATLEMLSNHNLSMLEFAMAPSHLDLPGWS